MIIKSFNYAIFKKIYITISGKIKLNYKNELSVESITRDLKTTFIGQRVFYYSSLTSTMDIARQEAKKGAAEGTIIIADEQTAGKGRLKRTWISPGGNIAMSVILYPRIDYLPSIIMIASLAVLHTINTVTGLKAQIKWPNDVLINNRKVCGILIENDVQSNTVNYTVIGIGINVNIRTGNFPEIVQMATSLIDELGKEISRLDLIRSLLVDIEKLYTILQTGGSFYEEWRDNLITLGKKVRLDTGEAIYEGVAESAARDGSLMLRQPDGSMIRVIAGDVNLTG